jgi:hypothetical protein
MQSNKTSKKTNKIVEKSAAPVSEQTVTDSKPAKRTTKSPTAAMSSTPQTTSHRHSKASVPATPVIEEVVVDVVVASPTPLSREDIARLAYRFWEERSYAHGFAEEDWHRAVKTLSASA